jgi:hypothetical protein
MLRFAVTDRRFNDGLYCPRSASALIAIAEAAEQPPKKQRHDGGCIWASPDGDVDVMVNATTVRLDWPINGSRSIPERAALGMDAREFRAHQHQLR